MKRIIKYLLLGLLLALIVYLVVPFSQKAHMNTTEKIRPERLVYDSCSTGVIIINTGTPASLTKKDVGCFIGDMLSDPYVMGMSEWFRVTLARKIIAPLRASSSLEKYSMIWGDSDFSPLLLTTLALADSVELNKSLPVSVAMRYGAPYIEDAIADLEKRCPNMKEVMILPLFPQYAESSYLTAVEAAQSSPAFQSGKYILKIIPPFYNNPIYISSLAKMIAGYIDTDYHLLFSFHSLPLSHIELGKTQEKDFDYEYQCCETARLVSQKLGINSDNYSVVYASAMGKKWQGPFLNEIVADLPRKNVRKVAVLAPGFIVDNLETLYDLNISARQEFMDKGGESFIFIPCLNSDFLSTAGDLLTKYRD